MKTIASITVMNIERYRVFKWTDLNTGAVWFGIQGKVEGERRYRHVAVDSRAAIFATREEAKQAITRLKSTDGPFSLVNGIQFQGWSGGERR